MSNSLGRLFALRRCVRNASPTVQGSSIDDESRGRVAFECADLTLAIVEHAVGPIPIGGPPLKAVIGGLRKLMEAGDVSCNALLASESFAEKILRSLFRTSRTCTISRKG